MERNFSIMTVFKGRSEEASESNRHIEGKEMLNRGGEGGLHNS